VNAAYENAVHRLIDIGIRAGVPEFDKRMDHFRNLKKVGYGPFGDFYRLIIAAGFIRAGYNDPEIVDFLQNQVDYVYKCAMRGEYNIYLPQSEVERLPKALHGKPVIRREFVPLIGDYPLPVIHHIYAFDGMLRSSVDKSTARKIDKIVEYILDPRYQSFSEGYGQFWMAEIKRFYAMGWSVHLPGFLGFDMSGFYRRFFIQRIELMSRFKAARESAWFKSSVEFLEQFKTDTGTYIFPREYLMECPSGYYVSGAYMGLGENRRSKMALELESTFRMVRLKLGK
jgi:hypothetical protein